MQSSKSHWILLSTIQSTPFVNKETPKPNNEETLAHLMGTFSIITFCNTVRSSSRKSLCDGRDLYLPKSSTWPPLRRPMDENPLPPRWFRWLRSRWNPPPPLPLAPRRLPPGCCCSWIGAIGPRGRSPPFDSWTRRAESLERRRTLDHSTSESSPKRRHSSSPTWFSTSYKEAT